MRRVIKTGLIFSLMGVLAACGAEHGYYNDHEHYSQPGETVLFAPEISKPRLQDFHMVDSYGIDSASHSQALVVDPYLDEGLFEIYWFADSWDDYWVEFYISDNPSMDGAEYVGSQMCGVGLDCSEDGLQFCQYSADLYLSCDTGEEHLADVSPLIYAIPQTLYFILQVCDYSFDYCEYSFRPVLFK
ncbi:hypothetical protein SAMN02745866_02961 [Alteromonadaceae bacterium Bs31]|nr:hypothetical protein SAMN02745866_02961 [Alteromonadaceae bacterium Bs31]